MARMIPTEISDDVKSNAERKIFQLFKTCKKTEDWVVFHGLGISNHKKVLYGEVDFFIIAPRLGMYALEVKGGRVSRKNGIWYFTNKYGRTSSKKRGPFDQANEGIFSIIKALKNRLDRSHQHIRHIMFGSGVMFPDIQFSSSDIDFDDWQVYDLSHNDDVYAYVVELFTNNKNKWEALYGHFPSNKLPSKDDVKYIAEILRPDFDFLLPLRNEMDNLQSKLISLTKEQYRCLDQLDDNPRCLIHGSAGTGKTLLALEEVTRSVISGKRVALFCYNSNLGHWLQEYYKNLPDSMRPDYVGTLHKFMIAILKTQGMYDDLDMGDLDPEDFYDWVLPKKTLEVLETHASQFDTIVIDEGQDLMGDYYIRIFDNILVNGFERGHWMLFGDFSLQSIYK